MYGFEMSTNQNGQAVLYGPLTIFVMHYTRHFDSSEFRDVFLACMSDCPIHPTVTWRDWEACCIPQDFGFKWVAICAFEKPRIAKLCSTKYERSGPDNKVGRIVVDKVIGIAAIQGHTHGESANNYKLLGWTKVDQAFTGTHIFFGFHQTTESKAWNILGSEGIFPGGPSCAGVEFARLRTVPRVPRHGHHAGGQGAHEPPQAAHPPRGRRSA